MTDFEIKVRNARPDNDADQEKWDRRAIEAEAFVKRHPYLFIATGLAAACFLFGSPHVLGTYRCSSGGCTPARAYSCDYVGIGGIKRGLDAQEDGCPIIRFL